MLPILLLHRNLYYCNRIDWNRLKSISIRIIISNDRNISVLIRLWMEIVCWCVFCMNFFAPFSYSVRFNCLVARNRKKPFAQQRHDTSPPPHLQHHPFSISLSSEWLLQENCFNLNILCHKKRTTKWIDSNRCFRILLRILTKIMQTFRFFFSLSCVHYVIMSRSKLE